MEFMGPIFAPTLKNYYFSPQYLSQKEYEKRMQ
jgi:hypothetical protein